MQQDNVSHFKKNINQDSYLNNQKINPQNMKIIEKLMLKYKLNEDEALKLFNKIQLKLNSEGSPKKKTIDQSKILPVEKESSVPYQRNKKQAKYFDDNVEFKLKKQDSNTLELKNVRVKKDINSIPLNKGNNSNQININQKFGDEKPKIQKHQKNVDNILSEIVPDYNKHISIEVKHIDLTFEVSTERIDTIKESVIRFLKRDKPKKMKIHALNDISFKIYKGEKIGIIGYNGAGKSTLLNVICGVYNPNNGNVKTNGKISPLLGLGAGFDQNYSGRRNIYFNGAVLGYSKKFLQTKEKDIIEFSELGEFIDIPIKNYSSGMLAKLGFSIATIVNPDILVIDEVLGVGDVTFAKKSRDKIRSLMDGGTTVLFVSHSIPQVRELCDKAIWLDNGKIREIGEVNKVCDHYIKDSENATNEQLANIEFR